MTSQKILTNYKLNSMHIMYYFAKCVANNQKHLLSFLPDFFPFDNWFERVHLSAGLIKINIVVRYRYSELARFHGLDLNQFHVRPFCACYSMHLDFMPLLFDVLWNTKCLGLNVLTYHMKTKDGSSFFFLQSACYVEWYFFLFYALV